MFILFLHSLLLDQHVVNMVTASKTHFMASTAVGKDRFLYMPPVIREKTGTHRHQCIEERNAFRYWSSCILWKRDVQPLTGPPSTRCCWEVLPGGFLSSLPLCCMMAPDWLPRSISCASLKGQSLQTMDYILEPRKFNRCFFQDRLLFLHFVALYFLRYSIKCSYESTF